MDAEKYFQKKKEMWNERYELDEEMTPEEKLLANWDDWRDKYTYEEIASTFLGIGSRKARWLANKNNLDKKRVSRQKKRQRKLEDKLLMFWDDWKDQYTVKEIAQKKLGVDPQRVWTIKERLDLDKPNVGRWDKPKNREKLKSILEDSTRLEEYRSRASEEFGIKKKTITEVTSRVVGEPPSNFLVQKGGWTDKELEELREVLEENPDKTYQEISDEYYPERTVYDVKNTVQNKLDVDRTRNKVRDLSPDERKILKEKSGDYTDQQIADACFGGEFSKREIENLRHRYDIYKRTRHPWTEEDLKILRENSDERPETIYREHMPYRSKHSVHMKMSELNLLRGHGKPRYWTEEKLDKVRKILKRHKSVSDSLDELRSELERKDLSVSAVMNAMRKYDKGVSKYVSSSSNEEVKSGSNSVRRCDKGHFVGEDGFCSQCDTEVRYNE